MPIIATRLVCSDYVVVDNTEYMGTVNNSTIHIIK